MSAADAFFDTNILLYLLSSDAAKADWAEGSLATGGVISVQVLNEFSAVARRKLGMSIEEIREAMAPIRSVCRVEPLTERTHDLGLQVSERYGFSVYDSMIVAAALLSECSILYSEDLQEGQVLEKRLTVRNPFRQAVEYGVGVANGGGAVDRPGHFTGNSDL